MMARSLWHVDTALSEIRTNELQNQKDETKRIITTNYSMVSTGTESLVAGGKINNTFAEKMSVPYMGGDFNFPIKYGYACSGVDESKKLYHFMHPHQDKCLVDSHMLFEIESLSALKTPLISNMETVLNGIWDAEIEAKDQIAIIGYGNVGSLLAQTLISYKKMTPTIIEVDDWRLQQAAQNGFKLDAEFQNKYDIIFNTSASNIGLAKGLERLNYEGKLVEMSWYGDRKVELSLGKEFHYNRLQLISSQVSSIPKKMQASFDYLKRKQLAAKLLEDEAYNKLITNVIDFNDAPTFFNDLRKKKIKQGLIYLFKY